MNDGVLRPEAGPSPRGGSGETKAAMGNLFRKRPVVIEARQWDGTLTSGERLAGWAATTGGSIAVWTLKGAARIAVMTLEGRMRAEPGDWIIKGVKGEFYPCKPDIFAATYEAVAEDAVEGQVRSEPKASEPVP